MATLESIDATLTALRATNASDHERIEFLVRQINGQVRDAGNRITRLEEQQSVRTGALGALTLAVGAVAAWLGIRT